MFRMIKLAVVVLAVFGAISLVRSAKAIELRNEDETQHQVKITSTAMEKDIAVRPMTLSLVVCVGECTFEVEGVGTVRASKNDVVTIRDGKVTTTTPAKTATR